MHSTAQEYLSCEFCRRGAGVAYRARQSMSFQYDRSRHLAVDVTRVAGKII